MENAPESQRNKPFSGLLPRETRCSAWDFRVFDLRPAASGDLGSRHDCDFNLRRFNARENS